MSTASSTSIEDAAAANGSGERWYQLYWPQNEHNNITISLLKRAKASGFTALVVTLDVSLFPSMLASSNLNAVPVIRPIFLAGVLPTLIRDTTPFSCQTLRV